ncbi:acetyl-CoA synthetase-like protein [Pholiota conissans]|uniref:Acetyl-CoA synthetase-like protein n=1 Tax=Pholiota conissans TaxID=109636 RepID=A0A9P6D3Q2_9AGAR|nr:acetyl-CoA synthetase-like protein [Pholiota conissans]
MSLVRSSVRRVSQLSASPTMLRRCLTKSSVQGPTEPPLSTKTLPEYFNTETLKKHSTRPALICRKEAPRSHGGPPSRNMSVNTHIAWDFAEFDRHINTLARGLLAMGVQKGDRVGVIMGNSSAYAMLQWACASIGAILVTLNPAYRLTELASTLNLTGVKHLFLIPRLRSSTYVRMFAEAFPEIRNQHPGELQIQDLPFLRNIVVVDNAELEKADLAQLHIKGTVDWREILIWREDVREAQIQKDITAGLHKDDIINLQFTSGTTGLPKAVSLTHSNLLNNGISIGKCMRLTENDILCNVPPLFHCFGLVLGNLAAWTHGSCIVYPSEIFDPPAIVDAVVGERCTALHGVPTHFLGVLSEVDKRKDVGSPADMSSLRTGIAAGSPIPIDLMKNLIGRMHLRDLTNAYGMTETSPVSFQTTPDDPIIKRVETVGKVQPHVKAKIIDADGRIVDVGKPGEICIAGYLLQKGYWEDEEQTHKAMKTDEDGILWMHTGDEGIMDEEGYLRVVGRIKDLIIRGGENLFPVQIENAMTAHHEIREAAAVAVPDDIYGEVVGAWIVREPHTQITREQVRESVASVMNPQNAPAWVWFVGEEEGLNDLPKTASGKVMKHVLRKWSRELVKAGVGRVYRE